MATAFRRRSFTFTWKITNYDFYFQYGAYHSSPWFAVDTLKGSRWRLCLIPDWTRDADDAISLRFENDALHCPYEEIDLNYCFSLSSDYSPVEVSSTYTFRKGSASPWISVPKAKVFKQKDAAFIPSHSLTIQCQIWKMNGSLAEDGECAAVTEVDVKRMTVVGKVTYFRGLTSYEKKIIQLKSASNERLPFYMNMGTTSEGTIFIELVANEKIRACKCVLHLLDNLGSKMICGGKKFVYCGRKPEKRWKFQLKLSKENLLTQEEKFLPNDCLSIECEIAFCTEKVRSRIIETKNETKFLPGNSSWIMQNDSEVAVEESRHSLKDDMLSLLSTGMLADVQLQTVNGTFHAHKNILSARSLVFKSVFTNNQKACIQIDDLDADTLHRLLTFLYSDSLPGLDFHSAKKLHFAAVKYGVLALRGKCSCFLEKSLSLTNCCDILLLAHEHCDPELKKSVQDYIAQRNGDVLLTSEWTNLEKTHPFLIIETFRIICQRSRGTM